jgi:hypothetical protein
MRPVVSNQDCSGFSCMGFRYTTQGSRTRTPSKAFAIAWLTMRLVNARGVKRCSRRRLIEMPSPTCPLVQDVKDTLAKDQGVALGGDDAWLRLRDGAGEPE